MSACSIWPPLLTRCFACCRQGASARPALQSFWSTPSWPLPWWRASTSSPAPAVIVPSPVCVPPPHSPGDPWRGLRVRWTFDWHGSPPPARYRERRSSRQHHSARGGPCLRLSMAFSWNPRGISPPPGLWVFDSAYHGFWPPRLYCPASRASAGLAGDCRHSAFGWARYAAALAWGVILLLVRTDLAFVVPFLPLGVIPITRR